MQENRPNPVEIYRNPQAEGGGAGGGVGGRAPHPSTRPLAPSWALAGLGKRGGGGGGARAPLSPPLPQPLDFQRFPMDLGGFLARGFALISLLSTKKALLLNHV